MTDYSIGIVHFGDPNLTDACVRSTLALDPPPAARVVVDNGALDVRVSSFSDVVRDHCQVITPERNLGYAGGANAAFDHIDPIGGAPYFWLLNNDARVRPDSVAPLIAALDADPSLAMVGPRILDGSGTRVWHDGGTIEWPDGRPRSPGVGESPTAPTPGTQPTDFVCGCAPLVRASAWRAAEGFDDDFFLYYEDTDLSYRLRALGWRIGHVPTASVEHEGSANTEPNSELSRYFQLRNRLRFVARHGPLGAAQRLRWRLRLRAARLFLTGGWTRGRTIARALRDADPDAR